VLTIVSLRYTTGVVIYVANHTEHFAFDPSQFLDIKSTVWGPKLYKTTQALVGRVLDDMTDIQ